MNRSTCLKNAKQSRKCRRSETVRSCRPWLEALEDRLAPAIFIVTTAADDALVPVTGSLREAIGLANYFHGPDEIRFNIPGAGPHIIQVLASLPPIIETVMIDGYSQPGAHANTQADGNNAVLKIELRGDYEALLATPNGLELRANGCTVQGLAIFHFTAAAISVYSDFNKIRGNFIGSDTTGIGIHSNWIGVYLGGSYNQVGGSQPGDRNLIADSDQAGLFIVDQAAGNRIQGNVIGGDWGTFGGPNSVGILVYAASTTDLPPNSLPNLIGGAGLGEGNVISNNRTQGISVEPGYLGGDDLPTTIRGNAIYGNGDLGIDLFEDYYGVTENDVGDADGALPDDARPNGLQNFPVLTTAVVNGNAIDISGQLDSIPGLTYTIELFADDTADRDGHGEGREFLAVFAIVSGAYFTESCRIHLPGAKFVSATATDAAGNTSEFSFALALPGLPPPPVPEVPIDFDNDGIYDGIEDGHPNKVPGTNFGDGDHNGKEDSIEFNVASFRNAASLGYVTLASAEGTILHHVRAANIPEPDGFDTPLGSFLYDVEGIEPGGATSVRMFLPIGTVIDRVMMFGREATNPKLHWYDFSFDGTTGAVVNGNVVTIHLVDGNPRGDGDGIANGWVYDPIAPAIDIGPIDVDVSLFDPVIFGNPRVPTLKTRKVVATVQRLNDDGDYVAIETPVQVTFREIQYDEYGHELISGDVYSTLTDSNGEAILDHFVHSFEVMTEIEARVEVDGHLESEATRIQWVAGKLDLTAFAEDGVVTAVLMRNLAVADPTFENPQAVNTPAASVELIFEPLRDGQILPNLSGTATTNGDGKAVYSYNNSGGISDEVRIRAHVITNFTPPFPGQPHYEDEVITIPSGGTTLIVSPTFQSVPMLGRAGALSDDEPGLAAVSAKVERNGVPVPGVWVLFEFEDGINAGYGREEVWDHSKGSAEAGITAAFLTGTGQVGYALGPGTQIRKGPQVLTNENGVAALTFWNSDPLLHFLAPGGIATPGRDHIRVSAFESTLFGGIAEVNWLPSSFTNDEERAHVEIEVDPMTGLGPVELTFDSVTREGISTLGRVVSDNIPPPPSNFAVVEKRNGAEVALAHYEISTTATFEGQVEVCIYYEGLQFQHAEDLHLMHLENGEWVESTFMISQEDREENLEEGRVCGTFTSLSPFAIFEFVQPPPPLVESVVLNDGTTVRDSISKITVTFSHEVTVDAGAFELRPQKGQAVTLNVSTSIVNGKTVAVLQVAGKAIKNSKLRLSLRGTKIVDEFTQLLDGNRDGAGGDDYGIDLVGAPFIDQDGDTYTISLKGPGQAFVTQDDPDADGRGPIRQIALQGTDPAKSTLTITVTKGKQGDGRVTVHDVVGTGLKSFTAATTDLIGGVFNLTGYGGAFIIGDIQAGADVTIATGTAKQTTAFTARTIGAGSLIDIRGPVSTFTAMAVGDAEITAPSIATLSIKGDARAKPKIIGDFLADLTLNGPAQPGKPVLGTATISGNIADAVWTIAGDIGRLTVNGTATNWNLDADAITQTAALGEVAQTKITVDRQVKSLSATTFINSLLFAGFQATNPQQPMLGGAFTPVGSIDSFKINGKKGSTAAAFAGSTVAAAKIGTVSLASIDADHDGDLFGILADLSIGGVSVKAPAFAFDKTKPTPQGKSDFQVRVV